MVSGAIKRFGSRYGRRVRHKLDAIETLQRARYECPSCGNDTVKRVAKGIWQCKKCNHKFTGAAYTIKRTSAVIQQKAESDDFNFEIEE